MPPPDSRAVSSTRSSRFCERVHVLFISWRRSPLSRRLMNYFIRLYTPCVRAPRCRILIEHGLSTGLQPGDATLSYGAPSCISANCHHAFRTVLRWYFTGIFETDLDFHLRHFRHLVGSKSRFSRVIHWFIECSSVSSHLIWFHSYSESLLQLGLGPFWKFEGSEINFEGLFTSLTNIRAYRAVLFDFIGV